MNWAGLTIALIILVLPSYAQGGQRLFSLTEQDEILVQLSVEELDIEIKEPRYKGLGSPVDALETFFYHSQQDDARRIIDMHSSVDGSRRYIIDQLYRNPNAFSGSDNLALLKINRIYKWGKHNIVEFEIVNNEGRSLSWFDDFICIDGRCEKSNYLNIFGESDSRILFSNLLRATRTEIENYNLDTFLSIDLRPNIVSGDFPLVMYYKVLALPTSGPMPEWFDMLMAAEKGDLEPGDKIDYLVSYLPTIFRDWEEADLVSIRFSSFRTEKDYIIQKLGVTSNLKVESSFELGDKVWIFFSTLDYRNEHSRTLFLFDKETALFQLETPDEIESKLADRLIRNKAFEAALFGLEQESIETESYVSRFDDGEIENFMASLPEKKGLPKSVAFYFVLAFVIIGIFGCLSFFALVYWKRSN